MFKELAPLLRDRAVLLTVTLVEADQIRVNIVPKKLKDGDNDALTTPLSVTGTAQMKNTLEKAKAEMDAASKAAQAEARSKSKTTAKPAPQKTDTIPSTAAANPAEPVKLAPPKTASLFDMPTPAATTTATSAESEEDDEPFIEIEDDEPVEETEELDDAA